MTVRKCAHCGKPIPDAMRHGAKFCKASCRVNHHLKTLQPTFTDDVSLSPAEAGLLLDAAVPWRMPGGPRGHGYGWAYALGKGRPLTPKEIEADREFRRHESMHKRFQRARRRLLALGLIEQTKTSFGNYVVVRRTPLGTKLVKRRHNELGAKAEHAGKALDPEGREYLWLREGLWGSRFKRGGGWE